YIFNQIRSAVRDVGGGVKGTWDSEIIDLLEPKESEFVIKKVRYDSFYSTNLDSVLRFNQIDSLIICGVTTNVCVASAARSASERDYEVFVISDATGEIETRFHDSALATLADYY